MLDFLKGLFWGELIEDKAKQARVLTRAMQKAYSDDTIRNLVNSDLTDIMKGITNEAFSGKEYLFYHLDCRYKRILQHQSADVERIFREVLSQYGFRHVYYYTTDFDGDGPSIKIFWIGRDYDYGY